MGSISISRRQTGIRTAAVLVVSAGCLGGAMLVAQTPAGQPQPRSDRLAAVSVPSRGRSVMLPKPDGVTPSAPAGFNVSSYAELRAPRVMLYAPNGDLFVSSPDANNITVLRDTDHDGVFEARSVYAQGESARRGGAAGAGAAPAVAGVPGPGSLRRGTPGPGAAGAAADPANPPPPPPPAAPPVVNPAINGPILGASAPACTPPPAFQATGPGALAAPFGMAFHNGYLYVGNTGSIIRYKYTPGDLQAQGEPEKLLDLPTGGHSTRNIVFNRAGTKMYVSVGSNSNNNAGEDCRRAAVLEFNPDGSGYRVYASGIRNPVGLTLQPGTDTIWVAVNERDNLGDDLVPDYATSIKDGGFYGWPYSYIGQHYDPRYVDAFPELVKRAIVPDVLIPAHSAALGIAFYTAGQFPPRYRNGAFVTLHGSWNRQVAAGYKVAFFPMSNGRPGPLEDFLTGFLVSDGSNNTAIERWGRPVGVTVTPDGALLVSDDGANRIWRISAGGSRRP
jgi:glucose/arabinose dehydrogenase